LNDNKLYICIITISIITIIQIMKIKRYIFNRM